MDGKDNRSKDKRSNMKQHPSSRAKQNRGHGRSSTTRNTTSSSSPQQQDGGVHSIFDAADSSDEPRFSGGRGWTGRRGGPPLPQTNLDRLNMPPMDDNLDGNEEKENEQLTAGDFQQMSELVSHGGHFAFEDEKNWSANLPQGEQEQKIIDANEYFTLNFKQLTAGLDSIPFYKRLDLSSAMFTSEQLDSMNKAAELAEHNYQERFVKKSVVVEQNDRESERGSESSVASEPDELDELLNITTQQVAKVTVEAATPTPTTPVPSAETAAPVEASAVVAPAENENDVQNWMDSVLEE